MTGTVVSKYHQLHLSRLQLALVFGAHLAALPIIFICVTPAVLKWSIIAGLVLSASIEHRRLIRQGNLRLRVDPRRAGIELRQGEQPYFYAKYKVYQTRWFAILKLIDTRTQRTLILSSDRFDSIDSYRRCRHDLRRLDGTDVT